MADDWTEALDRTYSPLDLKERIQLVATIAASFHVGLSDSHLKDLESCVARAGKLVRITEHYVRLGGLAGRGE